MITKIGLRFRVLVVMVFCLSSPAQGLEVDLRDLVSPEAAERLRTQQKILEYRSTLVEGLLKIAATEIKRAEEYSAQELAIQLLGEMRATEATDFLVERIDHWVPAIVLELHPLNNYPAAYALTRIGEPALHEIYDALGSIRSERDLQLFAWVFYYVDYLNGRDLVLHRLALMAAKSTGLRRSQIQVIQESLEESAPPWVFKPETVEPAADMRALRTAVSISRHGDRSLPHPELEPLTSTDVSVRLDAKSRLLEQREKLVDFLSEMVESQSAEAPNNSQSLAMMLLGRMRAREAISVLLTNIDRRSPVDIADDNPLRAYPAARALTEIGTPVFHELKHDLHKKKTDEELLLFAWIIRLVDGKEVGLKRLELMIEETRPGPGKAQLQEVRTILKKGELPPVAPSSPSEGSPKNGGYQSSSHGSESESIHERFEYVFSLEPGAELAIEKVRSLLAHRREILQRGDFLDFLLADVVERFFFVHVTRQITRDGVASTVVQSLLNQQRSDQSVQGEAKVAYPKTAMVQFPNGLPDGMSLGEAYEILEGDTAKPGSLPTRKLRLEPARETP